MIEFNGSIKPLTNEEHAFAGELLSLFRQLSPEKQEDALREIQALAGKLQGDAKNKTAA